MDVPTGQHLLTVSALAATGPPIGIVAYTLQYATRRLPDNYTLSRVHSCTIMT